MSGDKIGETHIPRHHVSCRAAYHTISSSASALFDLVLTLRLSPLPFPHLIPPFTTAAIMTLRALIPILVTMMLVTGVCNTILNKFQVRSYARPKTNPGPQLTLIKGHAMCTKLRLS